MSPARDYEPRIAALERAIGGNPGTFTKSDGVSLKEYIESRLAAQQDYFMALISTELSARDKALALASGIQDAKLEKMNEIRSQLDRQADTFITTDKLDSRISAVRGEIDGLRGRVEKYADKTEVQGMRDEVQKLKERDAELRGKASQTGLLLSYVLGFISLISGLIALAKVFGM